MAATLHKRLPLALSVLGLVLFASGAVIQLPRLQGQARLLAGFFIGLYVLWLAVEARIAAGEGKREETADDRGTLELYALARVLTGASALFLSAPSLPSLAYGLACTALFVGGIAFRLHAIRALGKFYSHRVRKTEGHRIIDTGPYRFLRHPAYTGMLIAHLGFVLFFFHWASMLLLLGLFLPAVLLRIRVEERMLFLIDGYAEYSYGRKRLIPGIW
ncbi:MAG: isoprenylcysteine carboxylmethyltransferase family protein [Deltaproteobacteria bacterium]|nr:isoprenylcysteine carboxylmethyltransferase family protein [Deltaproteobacteria bacterium]